MNRSTDIGESFGDILVGLVSELLEERVFLRVGVPAVLQVQRVVGAGQRRQRARAPRHPRAPHAPLALLLALRLGSGQYLRINKRPYAFQQMMYG